MLLFIGLIIALGSIKLVLQTLNMFFLLCMLIGMGIIVISRQRPISGWSEPEILEEKELLPLMPDSNYYACEDEDGNVIYRDVLDGKQILKSKLRSFIEYEELKLGDIPKMKKAKLTPKMSLWAFPLPYDKHITILCVPKDSIIK